LLLHVLRGCYGFLARTFLTYAKPQRDMPIAIYPS
jgi:hypothetical protein